MDGNLTSEFDVKGTRRVFSRIGFAFIALLAVHIVIPNLLWYVIEEFFDFTLDYWMLIIITCISDYLIAFPLFSLLTKKLPSEKPAEEKLTFKWWFIYLLISCTALLAGNFASQIVISIFSSITHINPENTVQKYLMEENSFFVNLIVIGILAPIAEELLFRKTIIDRTRKYGDKTALFLSAMFFGIAHLNIYQVFYAFAMGLVLGFVYIRYGNILHTILIHAAINLSSVITSAFLVSLNDKLSEFSDNYSDAILPPVTDFDIEVLSEFYDVLMPFLIFISIYALILFSFGISGLIFLVVYKKKFRIERKEGDIPRKHVGETVYLSVGIVAAILLGTAATILTMFSGIQ